MGTLDSSSQAGVGSAEKGILVPAIAQEALAACATPLGGFWLQGTEDSWENSLNHEGFLSLRDRPGAGQSQRGGFRSSTES